MAGIGIQIQGRGKPGRGGAEGSEGKTGGERKAPRRVGDRRGRLVRVAAVGTFAALATVVALFLFPELRAELGRLGDFRGGLDAAAIEDWILSFGAFSPLAYFLVVVAQVIVNPIPAGPVTFVGALVFGVWEGLALSMTGSVVGSILVFLAVRRWGAPLVVRLVGKKTFHKYVAKLDDRGWWIFVILLLPFMPDDAVCALAGLSAVRFRRFVVLMIVGRLPGASMTALLASGVETDSMKTSMTAGVVLVALLTLGFVYRERLEYWLLRGAGKEPRDGGV